mgnify:CR=1 FL=1
MTVVRKEYVELARRARLRIDLDARTGELVEVLLSLGGAAHRDMVIDRIAVRRSGNRASPGLAREVIEAFDAHRMAMIARGLPPLFHRPFGPDSLRWALTAEAHDFLSQALS